MIFTSGMRPTVAGDRNSTRTGEWRVALDRAALAAELEDMAAADHRLAAKGYSDDPAERLAWRRLTARHGDRLGAIMDEHGWPTADQVGEEAARAAWLIAQHADRQLDV